MGILLHDRGGACDFPVDRASFGGRLSLDVADEILDVAADDFDRQMTPAWQRVEDDGLLGGVLVVAVVLAATPGSVLPAAVVPPAA